MSGHSDLLQLLALRSLREERAKTNVSVAAARLADAERALVAADADIETHDREAGAQEQRFLAAMGMRPMSENELGRSRDVLGVSERKRESLIACRDDAVSAIARCKAELAEAQADWRRRLFERDKLAEAESLLRQQELGRRDAASEMDVEEMNADRVRLSC